MLLFWIISILRAICQVINFNWDWDKQNRLFHSHQKIQICRMVIDLELHQEGNSISSNNLLPLILRVIAIILNTFLHPLDFNICYLQGWKVALSRITIHSEVLSCSINQTWWFLIHPLRKIFQIVSLRKILLFSLTSLWRLLHCFLRKLQAQVRSLQERMDQPLKNSSRRWRQ